MLMWHLGSVNYAATWGPESSAHQQEFQIPYILIHFPAITGKYWMMAQLLESLKLTWDTFLDPARSSSSCQNYLEREAIHLSSLSIHLSLSNTLKVFLNAGGYKQCPKNREKEVVYEIIKINSLAFTQEGPWTRKRETQIAWSPSHRQG